MTFLKPDIHGISVRYVSLSGAASRYPLYLLCRCGGHKRIPLLSGLGQLHSLELYNSQ